MLRPRTTRTVRLFSFTVTFVNRIPRGGLTWILNARRLLQLRTGRPMAVFASELLTCWTGAAATGAAGAGAGAGAAQPAADDLARAGPLPASVIQFEQPLPSWSK